MKSDKRFREKKKPEGAVNYKNVYFQALYVKNDVIIHVKVYIKKIKLLD